MRSFKYLTICMASMLGVAPISNAQSALIDDIIVTEARRPQSSKTVAASIAVLDKDQIDSVAGIHPAETFNQIAGVNIHRNSGQEHLTAIRSPVLTGGAGAGSFLYLEDGVPLRAAGFSNVNGLFESGLELASGAEVVKGPGSVLYGSNAVHGLVNILSLAPEKKTEAAVNVLIGANEFASLKSTISGAFGAGTARASLALVHDGGFRDNSGFDQQKFQLRYDGEIAGWDTESLLTFTNLNQETAGFIQGPSVYLDEDISSQNPNPEAYRDARSARVQIRLSKQNSDSSTFNVTPYLRWTDMEFLRHFVPGQAREENGHKSIGMLLNYYRPRAAGDLTLGFDAEYTDGFLVEFQDNPTRFSFIQGEHYDYQVQSLVLSGYGQYEFDVSSRTRLSLGARADYTNYDYDNQIDSGIFGRFQRIDDQSDNFFIVTPKISLTHSINDRSVWYMRAARGSRAPQTSDLFSLQINQIPSEIESETLDALESGVKTRIGAFNLELAAYYMKKDNFFFRNAAGFNVTGGTTDHLGMEASFNGQVTPRVKLSGDASWARHRYTFDDGSSGIVSGSDVDAAPRHLANIRADYTVTDQFDIGLEWRHMGDYFTNPANTQTYPGHDVFVLRARFNLADTAIYARVDNLFDIRYANRADFAFGNERYFPGRPRSLFVGVRQQF
ncbi:MAG: TonB-dependent receptor [Hyphomonadaceae bacterium]|nr:TonB-dependent receptor [Hyphomonadaceae bacterium]